VSRSAEVGVVDDYGRERERYKIPYGAVLFCSGKARRSAQAILLSPGIRIYAFPVITEVDGIVELIHFVDGVTVQKQSDEVTGFKFAGCYRPKATRDQQARNCAPW